MFRYCLNQLRLLSRPSDPMRCEQSNDGRPSALSCEGQPTDVQVEVVATSGTVPLLRNNADASDGGE